ncbi:MAG: riboflavin biosynthesis protein RibF [Phycisphaeraceae bacterium]|nr:riboflavin biosynthesis protein RibF [Phycisphaeraceae bacterium]
MNQSVLTVGNFDGVHRAHQALLAAVRSEARDRGLEPVVLCFEKHPAASLRPDQAPAPLMDVAQRRDALEEAGIGRVVDLPADPSILSLEPEAFVRKVVAEHRPALWVEGPDFRFGARRQGDMALLGRLGADLGFEVRRIEPIEISLRTGQQVRISSTLIRWLVGQGRVAEAAECLGRPFAVAGVVVRGDRKGRDFGFPTINLKTEGRQLPADGVYAGWTELDGEPKAAAISVGTKPTCGDHDRVFEAHLLDVSKDLYGRRMQVRVLRWLRDQIKFQKTEDLIEQMHRDVARVRQVETNAAMAEPS